MSGDSNVPRAKAEVRRRRCMTGFKSCSFGSGSSMCTQKPGAENQDSSIDNFGKRI